MTWWAVGRNDGYPKGIEMGGVEVGSERDGDMLTCGCTNIVTM